MQAVPTQTQAPRRYQLDNRRVVGPEGAAMVAYVMELGHKLANTRQARQRAAEMDVAQARWQATDAQIRQQEAERDAEYQRQQRRAAALTRGARMQARGYVRKPVMAGPNWTVGWAQEQLGHRVPGVKWKHLPAELGTGAILWAVEALERMQARGQKAHDVTGFIRQEALNVMQGKRMVWVPPAPQNAQAAS